MSHRLAALFFASVAACGGAQTVLDTVAVQGLVLDEEGRPLPGTEVQLGMAGVVATADGAGAFAVPDSPLYGQQVITFSAPGYATAYLLRDLSRGFTNEVSAQLKRRAPAQDVVLPPVGQSVSVKQDYAELVIQGGALCTQDGAVVTGSVQVQITTFDRATRKVVAGSPVTEDGISIGHAGMAEVDIAQSGAELTLCNGAGVELRTKRDERVQPADVAKLRFSVLDMITGRWKPVSGARYDAEHDTLNAPIKALEPHCDYFVPPPPPPEPASVVGTATGPGGKPVQVVVSANVLDGDGLHQTQTDAAGGYAMTLGYRAFFEVQSFTTDMSATAPPMMKLENPPGRVTAPVGTTRVDLRYCWAPNAPCDKGDRCCDGKTCQDGACL